MKSNAHVKDFRVRLL